MKPSSDQSVSLIEANDLKNFSFDQIADLIESNAEGLFEPDVPTSGTPIPTQTDK